MVCRYDNKLTTLLADDEPKAYLQGAALTERRCYPDSVCLQGCGTRFAFGWLCIAHCPAE
jgi:hypothetical protein